jgi:CBS domain-containing protein
MTTITGSRSKPRSKEPRARDVMTTEVVKVPADLTVAELADVFMENEISGAPVVDEDGALVGVVSVFDVARQSSGETGVVTEQGNPEFYVRGWEEQYTVEEFRKLRVQEGHLTVRDVMTPAAFTVEEDDPISDVARTLVDGHIHRVLVTRGHEVVGIISSLDLLRAYLGKM